MEKILYHANNWNSFAELIKYRDLIERNGIELAVSTYNKSLVPVLAVNKLLLVNPDKYYPDLLIDRTGSSKLSKENTMKWSEFKQVLDDELS